MVHRVLLWRQFYQVILVNVRRVVPFTLLSGIINAIEDYLLGLLRVVE